MTPDQAVTYLSSVGFPIIACYYMYKFINTTLADLSKSMAENTLALQKLCDKLGGELDNEKSENVD